MTKRSFLIYYNDYINPTPPQLRPNSPRNTARRTTPKTKNQKATQAPQPHPLTKPTLPTSRSQERHEERREENSGIPPPSGPGRINTVLHPSSILLFLHLCRLFFYFITMTERSFLIYYNDYINLTPPQLRPNSPMNLTTNRRTTPKTKNQKAPHKPPSPILYRRVANV